MFAYLKSLLARASWLYFKNEPLLGLDLGFNEIRLLQLEKRDAGFHIERLLVEPLVPVAKEKKMTWAEASAALAALVAREGLSGYAAALALPAAAIIKKEVELPWQLNEDEVAAELELRLGEYFPGLSEKEIHFDFAPRAGTEEKRRVLLVAARKEQLLTQVEAVKKAGLRVKLVDADLYAWTRAAAGFFYQAGETRNNTVALLDLSRPVFTFLVFNSDDLIFHHQWWVEREAFEAPLVSDSFIQQMRQVWQLCKATHPELGLEDFGVCGELAGLASVAAQLRSQLALPARVLPIFRQMTQSPRLKAETVDALASRFLLCCGLALRGPAPW